MAREGEGREAKLRRPASSADPASRSRTATPWHAHRRGRRRSSPAFEQRVLPAGDAATPSTAELFRIARHLRPAGRGAAEAERRPAARVPRLEPGIAEVPALLARRRSTPSWSARSWPASLTFLAENLGGEHPLVVKRAGRQDPGGPGRRAGRRHQAVRPGRAEAAGRRRPDGHRGSRTTR